MTTYGTRTTTRAMARRLEELLPELGIDFEIIASELVEACDLAPIQQIDERQRSMEECIQKLMEMYGSMLASTRARIAALESERTELHLRLAKHSSPAEIASR